MKSVLLNVDDAAFLEMEFILSKIKKSRNRYINEALKEYNKVQQRKILETKLKSESKLVSDKSQAIFPEFGDMHDAG